ncbi:MAG: hypothetical protein ABWZ25_09230 [Chitinophagaceae bacterium]
MSITIYSIAIILTNAISGTVHTQDSLPRSTFSFAFGVTRIADKDLFHSPYTYRGTNMLLNAGYTRWGTKGQHIVEVNYSGGKLAAVVAPKAEGRLLMFNYAYLFNLGPANANRKLIPALGIGLNTLMSTMNYLPKIESPKTYLTAGAYLTLRGNLIYNFSHISSFKIKAALPFAGLVHRPDFDINGKTQITVTHIGESGLFSAGLEYSYKLNPRLHLTAAYAYTFFTFDHPRPVTILQNDLSVGIKRTW